MTHIPDERYRLLHLYDLQKPIAIGNFDESTSRIQLPYNPSTNSKKMICAARKSGCIAAVVFPSPMPSPQGAQALDTRRNEGPEIRIYSPSGKEHGRHPIRRRHRIVGLGWSEDEVLVCVHDDGIVVAYSVEADVIDIYDGTADADPQLSFAILDSVITDDIRVEDCFVWSYGISVLMSDNQLLLVELSSRGDSEPAIDIRVPMNANLQQHLMNGRRAVLCMVVLEPAPQNKATARTFLATNDKTVLSIDHITGDCRDLNLQKRLNTERGPITDMALSPNGQFVACFQEGGGLSVFSSNDFTTLRSNYEADTDSLHSPLQMTWCGDDTVIMAWKKNENTALILLCNAMMKSVEVDYPYPMLILPDVDSCLIFTEATCCVLECVSLFIEDAEQWTSAHPSFKLCMACEAFERQCDNTGCCETAVFHHGDMISPKFCIDHKEIDMCDSGTSDLKELISILNLNAAIKGCLEAARAEYDPRAQRKYLKSAIYAITRGRMLLAFSNERRSASIDDSSNMDCDEGSEFGFGWLRVDIELLSCRLGVLNQVRHWSVGMPLSSHQLNSISFEGLRRRLLSNRELWTILDICSYLEKLAEATEQFGNGETEPIEVTGAANLNASATLYGCSDSLEEPPSWMENNLVEIAVDCFASADGSSIVDHVAALANNYRPILCRNLLLICLENSAQTPNLLEQGKRMFLLLVERLLRPRDGMPRELRAQKIRELLEHTVADTETRVHQMRLLLCTEDFGGTVQLPHQAQAGLQLDLSFMLILGGDPGKLCDVMRSSSEDGSIQNATALLRSLKWKGGKNLKGVLMKQHRYILNDSHERGMLAVTRGHTQSGLRTEELDCGIGLFNEGVRALMFHKKTTEDQIRLLSKRRNIQKCYGTVSCFANSVNLSLHGTLHIMVVMAARTQQGTHTANREAMFRELEITRKEFNISIKRFWYVKVNALAMSAEWEKLFKESRFSPIGHVSFVRACMKEELGPKKVRLSQLLWVACFLKL